jgi:hypothetical protein
MIWIRDKAEPEGFKAISRWLRSLSDATTGIRLQMFLLTLEGSQSLLVESAAP